MSPIPPDRTSQLFAQVFLAAGWHLHQTLIWVKDAFVLGHSDYHYRHEPILYGWKGSKHPWYGGRDQQSVFEVAQTAPQPRAPHRQAGRAGGGPAAQQQQARPTGLRPLLRLRHHPHRRRAARPPLVYAMEIDPRYVDVCLRRWQAYTGLDALLLDDGRSFRQVEEARDGR